jgi:hypothetical protein
MGQVSEIGRKSQIGKSKFPRSWNAHNRKSRSAISRRDQHRPSARTRGERSQKVGVRHIGNRRIGDFKDMKPLHHKTAICEFPTPSWVIDPRDACRASGENRERGYRESRIYVFCVIENAETPMEGYSATVDYGFCLINPSSILDKLDGWPSLANLILKSNTSKVRRIGWPMPLAEACERVTRPR